jgi:hypothetical protein
VICRAGMRDFWLRVMDITLTLKPGTANALETHENVAVSDCLFWQPACIFIMVVTVEHMFVNGMVSRTSSSLER